MMRNQRGITLIALVITIIVLLILAGVSIAMLTGDNGILTNSTKAKAQNELGTAKDQIALAANEALTDYYAGVYASNNTTGEYDDEAVVTAVINAIKAADIVDTVDLEDSTLTGANTSFKLTCNDWYVEGTVDAKGGLSWGQFKNS